MIVEFNFDLDDTFGPVTVTANVKATPEYDYAQRTLYDLDVVKITITDENDQDVTAAVKENKEDFMAIIEEAEITALNNLSSPLH